MLQGSALHRSRRLRIPALLLSLAAACSPATETAPPAPPPPLAVADAQSFARPDQVAIRHLDLVAAVDFDLRRIRATASLQLDRRSDAQQLILDTRGLDIHQVTLDDGVETTFELGEEHPRLGRSLTVALRPETQVVHVDYSTQPDALALQWLRPEQTAGGRQPFLFTQSQPIFARTWIPIQDTPQVRLTYSVTLQVPPDLLPLMSASNPQARNADGVYRFEMPQPVPAYLLALAVGDLEFRSLGERTGVYAEPSVLEGAVWELEGTEAMVDRAEELYGPYRWERFDLLVLPPSFPFGGMENPRLTFATPTILAGDRSLVTLVAHELAHSWSGNLVTNATWNDLWLNEGFTVYFELRIMESLAGREYSEMLAELGFQDLQKTLAEDGEDAPSTRLHQDLGSADDPDDAFSDIAYQKGYFFLRTIEETVGRERFDAFLRLYFDTFAFQSMDSERFVAYLRQNLVSGDDSLEEALRIDEWVYDPGLPANVARPEAHAFDLVDAALAAWNAGTPAAGLDAAGFEIGSWTTHHWLHFLRHLPPDLDPRRMAELDDAFGFTDTGNSEILEAWLEHAIAQRYDPADAALERFLTGMGRIKFLAPLYRELAKTSEGLERARQIYARARPRYHPLAVQVVDAILGWQEGAARPLPRAA